MKEKGMYTRTEIQDILECERSKAYDVIAELNKERAQKGLIVVKGKIPAQYFNQKFYGE